MKKILLIIPIFISTLCFAQFDLVGLFSIKQLTTEQLEAKYDLEPTGKTIKDKTSYNIYDVSIMDAKWKLFVSEGKSSISKAFITTDSPEKNTIFAKISSAFSERISDRSLMVNSTKVKIPYFTAEEFRNAYYKNKKDGDAETLKTKTASFKIKLSTTSASVVNDKDLLIISAD